MFTRSYETQLLYEKIKAHMQNGDGVLMYADLTSACGRDVQTEGRGNLHTACRQVERETSVLIGVARGVGIYALPVKEQAGLGSDALAVIRRKSRRALNRMGLAKFDQMSDEEKVRHNATASVLGAVQLFAKPKSIAKVEESSKTKLPIDEALKLFSPRDKP